MVYRDMVVMLSSRGSGPHPPHVLRVYVVPCSCSCLVNLEIFDERNVKNPVSFRFLFSPTFPTVERQV